MHFANILKYTFSLKSLCTTGLILVMLLGVFFMGISSLRGQQGHLFTLQKVNAVAALLQEADHLRSRRTGFFKPCRPELRLSMREKKPMLAPMSNATSPGDTEAFKSLTSGASCQFFMAA
jgi:hypothetical protein